MINTTQFTTYMETLFEGNTDEIRSFYSREDYEMAISRYKHARRDAKPFRYRDLDKLCQARDIDTEELLMFPDKLKTIPTREEMKDKLLDVFHSLYEDVPTPAQYMERIVRRLAPEYSDDPVRVAILKKYVLGGGFDWKTYHTKSIIAWAVDRMTPDEKVLYEALPSDEKLTMSVSKLDDSIFKECSQAGQLTPTKRLFLIKQNLDRLPERKIVLAARNPQEYQAVFDYLCERFLISAELNTYNRLMELSEKFAGETSASRQLLAEEFLQAVYPELTRSAKIYSEKVADIACSAGSMIPVFSFLCEHFSVPENPDVHGRILELSKRNFLDDARPLAEEYMGQYHMEMPASCEAYADKFERVLWCIEKLACAKDIKKRDPLSVLIVGKKVDAQTSAQKLAEHFISNEDSTSAQPDEALGCAKDKARYDQLLGNSISFINYLEQLNLKWIEFQNAVVERCTRYCVTITTIPEMLSGLMEQLDRREKSDNSKFVDSIEASFCQYVSVLYYISRDNRIKRAWELFDNSVDDARASVGDDWKLLALCNEFSNGYYKSNGKTRTDLYHFAIIFGMTIKLQKSDISDPNTDIVKNLFQDYYTDNLIRYLSKDYEDPIIAGSLEREPSGEGINFKNFAEVIYILSVPSGFEVDSW